MEKKVFSRFPWLINSGKCWILMCLHHGKKKIFKHLIEALREKCNKISRVMFLAGLDSLTWPEPHPVPLGKSWHSTRPYYPIFLTDLKSRWCGDAEGEFCSQVVTPRQNGEGDARVRDSVVGRWGWEAINYGHGPQPHLPHRDGKALQTSCECLLVNCFAPRVHCRENSVIHFCSPQRDIRMGQCD